jgi:hypothetical protein
LKISFIQRTLRNVLIAAKHYYFAQRIGLNRKSLLMVSRRGVKDVIKLGDKKEMNLNQKMM